MTLTLSQVTKGLFQANLFVQVTLILSPATQTTLPLYKGTLSSDSLCCSDSCITSIISLYIDSLFLCDTKSLSLSYHATLSATHIHTHIPAHNTHTHSYTCVRRQQQHTAQSYRTSFFVTHMHKHIRASGTSSSRRRRCR